MGRSVQTHTPLRRRIISLIGSRRFFLCVIAVFVLEALWIAASGRYPMAFDEDFHLGIIRLYAHHASPFWSGQPPGASAFGAVFRDPSYLYHYLMSFPYRFSGLFTHNQTVQILFLRVIDIGLFAWGLFIYRKLLLRTKASPAMVHAVLLLFILIPVVPLLAAQINYDNLFLPLTGLILLLTLRFNDSLTARKRIDAVMLGWVITLCLFASLVKYAFLPIFVAVVGYILIRSWQVFGSLTALGAAIRRSVHGLRATTVTVLIIGLLLSGTLFVQRYGINIVRYHTPVPDCGAVLSVEECSQYPPWARDYQSKLRKDPGATKNPAIFAADWFYGMWLRMLFAVDGPMTDFQTRGPLLLPAIDTIVFACGGFIISLIYGRRVLRSYAAPVLGLMLLVAALYIAALWVDGYQTFVRTGKAVAINGRYLFPVLPFLMLFAALAVNEACRRRDNLKLAVAGTALVCLLWGGGGLTYILRSTDAWYWPNTPLKAPSSVLRRTVGPIVPGYHTPSAFMGHN